MQSLLMRTDGRAYVQFLCSQWAIGNSAWKRLGVRLVGVCAVGRLASSAALALAVKGLSRMFSHHSLEACVYLERRPKEWLAKFAFRMKEREFRLS